MKGDYDSAKTMAQKSLDLSEEVPGEKHLNTLCSLSNSGAVLWKQGKNNTAEKNQSASAEGPRRDVRKKGSQHAGEPQWIGEHALRSKQVRRGRRIESTSAKRY